MRGKSKCSDMRFLLRLLQSAVALQVSTLVLAERTNDNKLSGSTLNAISAALELGGPVSLLVTGSGIGEVAQSARSVAGVSQVVAPAMRCVAWKHVAMQKEHFQAFIGLTLTLPDWTAMCEATIKHTPLVCHIYDCTHKR